MPVFSGFHPPPRTYKSLTISVEAFPFDPAILSCSDSKSFGCDF